MHFEVLRQMVSCYMSWTKTAETHFRVFDAVLPFRELLTAIIHTRRKMLNSKENEIEQLKTGEWYTSATPLHFRLIRRKNFFFRKSLAQAHIVRNCSVFTHDRRHFYSIFTRYHTRKKPKNLGQTNVLMRWWILLIHCTITGNWNLFLLLRETPQNKTKIADGLTVRGDDVISSESKTEMWQKNERELIPLKMKDRNNSCDMSS